MPTLDEIDAEIAKRERMSAIDAEIAKREQQETAMGEDIVGGLETAATIASGAVAEPIASAMTRYFGIDSGACDNSIDTGLPRKTPVTNSLSISSRSMMTVPFSSRNGASNP